jgi:hypothetical protein
MVEKKTKSDSLLRQVNIDGKAGFLLGACGGCDFESTYSVLNDCDDESSTTNNDFVFARADQDGFFDGNRGRPAGAHAAKF